ncbi:MAG: hypothetical protein J5982_04095 [Bacilli bacterium]|nr:hypothetical protein [Bacilli bacterium]
MAKDNSVLLRAESIINKYKNDDSIYYRELVKTYKEYKKSTNNDSIRNELYVSHINDLCNLIIEGKRSNITIILMILVLVIALGLSGYSTYKFIDISNNLNKNIIKVNKANSLIVKFENLDNFNALVLSDVSNYKKLKPLTLNLLNHSVDEKDMHYDVYLVEENSSIDDGMIIPRDTFLYHVESDSIDNGIKYLGNCIEDGNKIRIFSGTIKANEMIDIKLRMWLDSSSKNDYTNKKYRFKIFVDGYTL